MDKIIKMLRPVHIVRFILLSQLFVLTFLSGQDSLHLVATLVGPEIEHPIHDFKAKGIGDINGDGYDDIVISFRNYCNIYFGGDPFDLVPDIKFTGGFFQTPGDVNNDQFDDIIIGYYQYPGYSIFKLYFGGVEVDTIPDFTHDATRFINEAFISSGAIGDVNNDGYNDFVLSGFYNWSNGLGHVYLFYGGETIKSEPDIIFIGPSTDTWYGRSVSGIGDANQDGYNDLIISSIYLNSSDSSYVYLYHGGSTIDTIADRIFIGIHNDSDYGRTTNYTGNLNGDNFSNFLITSLPYTYLYIGLDSVLVINSLEFGEGENECSTGNGDINNDGFNDFLIGKPHYRDKNGNAIGAAFLFYGGLSLDTIPDFIIEGESLNGDFAKEVSIVGDWNNDGFDDVIIIAPHYPDYEHSLGKFYFYSYKDTPINESKSISNNVPPGYHLFQNFPNPFNNTTTIQFSLDENSYICLSIYNCLGERITTLEERDYYRGNHQVQWNGTDMRGQPVTSGIYFIELRAVSENKNEVYKNVNKVVLIK